MVPHHRQTRAMRTTLGRPRPFRLLLPVLAGLFVAACSTDSDVPMSPDEVAANVMAAGGTIPLTVQVFRPDGVTPVDKATVRVYGIRANGTVGPIANGTLLTGANGAATFQLASGNYCVSVRVAPPSWTSLDIVVPETPLVFTDVPNAPGPVVTVPARGGAKFTSAAFSPAAFRDCYTELPIRHGGNSTTIQIVMAQALNLAPTVIDLNGGVLTGVDVYAVMPVSVPWRDPFGEVETAFFSAVDKTGSPANAIVSAVAPWALEFQMMGQTGFNLTASRRGNGAPSQPIVLEAAPLMCRQNTDTYPAGQPNVDLLGAGWGYHARVDADPAVLLTPDSGMAAVQIRHQGSGSMSVSFRTDLPNGQWSTTVDIVCQGRNCALASNPTLSPAGTNDQTVSVFHSCVGGNANCAGAAGIAKTSIVLGNLPPNHTRLLWSVKTQGDKAPLAARNDTFEAFYLIPKPATCSTKQGNDDKWAVGDI